MTLSKTVNLGICAVIAVCFIVVHVVSYNSSGTRIKTKGLKLVSRRLPLIQVSRFPLNKETKTSLLTSHFHQLFRKGPQGILRPARHSPYSQVGMPETPPQGGVQEAS